MEKSEETNRENVGRLFEKKNMQIRQLTMERDQLKAELNIWTEKDGSNSMTIKQLVDRNNQLQKQISDYGRKTVSRTTVQPEKDQLGSELTAEKERCLKISEQLIYQNSQLLQQNVQLQTVMQTLRDDLKAKNEEIEQIRRQQEQRRSAQQQRVDQHNNNRTQLVTKGGQMQNFQYGNNSGKFVFVSSYIIFPPFLSSDNVESIDYRDENKLDSLIHNISSYKKELLVWTYWESMNTTSGYADVYANLLSLCRDWKRLRPDGEIHCLYWYDKEESHLELDKELWSLLTTCNIYLRTDVASKFSAFRQYWPNFVDSILSEKTKKEFPK